MYPTTAISSNGQTLRYYNCITTKKGNCFNKRIYKDFIEGVVDEFLITQFNIPKNLEEISNKIFELHKKRSKTISSLQSLKSDLQKVENSISNIVVAIERGIITETTKSRLEELEKTKKDLQEKIVIAESKQQIDLTKEDIQNFFKHTMKQSPNQAIDTFIRTVKVYNDKIEITLNSTTQATNSEPTAEKLFTVSNTTTRHYKGNSSRTKSQSYDVYVIFLCV